MIEGVDYSTDHPSATGLVSVGKVFAGRYVGAGYGTKLLQLPEAQELSDAGLLIVSLVEGAGADALSGYPKGVEQAREAEAWHRDRGFPWPVPCYFSVDFDIQARDWPVVRAYFHGAASVIGLSNTGIYGSFNAMKWASADQIARWFFQTYAWSGDFWFVGNHIEQYRNEVSLVGGTVDLDRAMQPVYGGWSMTNTQPPADSTELDIFAVQAAIAAAADKATRKGAALNMDLRPMWGRIGQEAADEIGRRIAAGILDMGAAGAPITIDAVHVARALTSDATFVAELAAAIATQLSTIQGEITLTGTLAAGIRPPAP